MSVVSKLLSVFRIEQQILGLKERLARADKFLLSQQTELAEVTRQIATLEAQLGAIAAPVMDARAAAKCQELEIAIKDKYAARSERIQIVDRIAKERDAMALDFEPLLADLQQEKIAQTRDVPFEAMQVLEAALKMHGTDAMSPVELVDRRRGEWTCSNCQMSLPSEAVHSLSMSKLTICPSCRCILFTEEDIVPEKRVNDDTAMGRPPITVIWDPSVVSDKTYEQLIAFLGDLVRAEGGLGVVRIGSTSSGAASRERVPQ